MLYPPDERRGCIGTALGKLGDKRAPGVLFIDKADGIGRRSHGGAESELNRIINRLLVKIDGFEALDNVSVVGATKHEDNADKAMRRAGRVDVLMCLGLPKLPDRHGLFEPCINRPRHDGRADSALLARMTAGMPRPTSPPPVIACRAARSPT